jgi:hypothetical protein
MHAVKALEFTHPVPETETGLIFWRIRKIAKSDY